MKKSILALGIIVSLFSSSNVYASDNIEASADLEPMIEQKIETTDKEDAVVTKEEPIVKKELTIDEKLDILQKEIEELKLENKKLGKSTTELERLSERIQFIVAGKIETGATKSSDTNDEWEDISKSYFQLIFGAKAKLNDQWSINWNQKAKLLWRGNVGTGPSGKSSGTWVSNLTFDGKDIKCLGGSDVSVGKFREQQITGYTLGKLDMTGIKITKDFTNAGTKVKLVYGRMPQDTPSFRTPILNPGDNAFIVATEVDQTVGHNSVIKAAYRRVESTNSLSNVEVGWYFPIKDKWSGNAVYMKGFLPSGSKPSVTGDSGYAFGLTYGKFNPNKAHSDQVYLRYSKVPSDTVIYGGERGVINNYTWRIGYTNVLSKGVVLDTYYDHYKAIDTNKTGQKIGAMLNFRLI
jgi:hypothetical protein